MTDHQLNTRGNAAPESLARAGGLGALAGASRSATGWLGNITAGPLQPHAAPPGGNPHAVAAGNLAGIARQAKGTVSHVAPALDAAARGESVAEQATRVTGAVKMTAADALHVAGALDPHAGAAAQKAMQASNATSTTGYRSPFVTIGLAGITNDQEQAEAMSRTITGNQHAHGYATYGANPNSYSADTGGAQPGMDSASAKKGKVDALTDVAAVTQYAAAAELGIKLTPSAKGGGQQVQIDWGALSKMDVQADMGKLGNKVKYDNPTQVANNGYQAVLADMATHGKKPDDKGQFISLTGHSGGGQSSFYTALKLASEGYKNVSVVGVDMAMSPHERETLQALGVNVTNITSNSNLPIGNGRITSPVGDGIRAGMGGGQNFYDLNVHRQNDTLDPSGLHSITNDANVVSTVRFAQYLDATGQHGNYSPAQYAQFLKDTGGTGNQVSTGKDKSGQPLPMSTADADLFTPGSGKLVDQRQRPGADQNSPQLGGGASTIETIVNLLGGKPVTQAIQGVGNKIHNGFDAAGDVAKSAAGLIPKAGGFLGGLFHKGTELLGSGVSAAGNLLGSGLGGAGNLAQSALSGVAGLSSAAGSAASSGLHAVGDGISAVGSTIGNGLDKAGDTAQSWLGHVPLVGGFLGRAANKGMDLLGSGVSGVGKLLGNGASAVGDAAQWAGGKVAGAASGLGSLAHQGLDAVGSGASWLGGALGGGLGKLGGWGQSALTSATSAAGNFLGNAASSGLSAIGTGIDNGFGWLGDKAGSLVRKGTAPLVHGLQDMGVDISQVASLSDFQSTNRSEIWKRQLAADRAAGVPSNVQTIDIPDPHAAAPAPVHSHYAN